MNKHSTSATEMLTTATKSAHDGLLKFETLLRTINYVDEQLFSSTLKKS